MIKFTSALFLMLAFSVNAQATDNWPDATLLLVNNSGYSIQVQIPQQLGLSPKIVNLRDDGNQKVTVKIPMDATLELRIPNGALKTSYCEVSLSQVLEGGKNEISISAATCPNTPATLICRQSMENK
jgi:hypothetical protein